MSRERPRIGLFDLSDSPSGLTRYVNGILDAICTREFDVVVFCHPRTPYQLRHGVRFCPIQLKHEATLSSTAGHPTSSQRGIRSTLSRLWRKAVPADIRYAVGYVRAASRIARGLRAESVDLLHTSECGCMESVLAAKLARVPCVVATYHTDSNYDHLAGRLTPGYRLLERATNRLLDQAIAVSESTRQDRVRCTRIPASRVVTIHNGIDPERVAMMDTRLARAALQLPNDRVLVGAVGQLQPYKGFDILLRSFSLVASAHPEADLVIAGAGPLRPELESLAEQLGLAARVHFLGFQPNVSLVLSAFDVYVLSSRCEALPYALLEAMAARLPVVATSVGGIPEVIEHGSSGFLVPPGQVEPLTNGIARLIRSETLRRRVGLAAYDRVVTGFHERDSARQTIDVYRQLLKQQIRSTISGQFRPQPLASPQ